MITWERQGHALVGSAHLLNGQVGKVVLTAGDDSGPQALLLVWDEAVSGEGPTSTPLATSVSLFTPALLMFILCQQERAFGKHGLPATASS